MTSRILEKRGPLLLAVTAALFFFHIFPAEPCGAESARDAFVTSGSGDARILIPFLADDTSSSSICEMVFNGLTKVDKDLCIRGDLAERWEIERGGRSMTFYLRKGVRWHDGVPFTAGDVKFTYEAILDPSTACPYVSSYSGITSIEVIDDHTVRFEYSEPYAPALLKFGMGLIPEHLFREEEDIRRSPYARAPVGTGPYKFSRWESGRYIILDANPDYFEHGPHVLRYVYRVIPDQAVQFLELISGGVDSMSLSPYQYVYRSDTDAFRDHIDKYRYLAHSYTYIGYNLRDPLFSDRRVRKALSCAIDREKLIRAVLLGLGEPCTGPFLKDSPFYDRSVEGYGYDPGKARSLLSEAGWEDTDGDGFLDRNGEVLEFTLAVNQGNQVREDVATVVQSQWAGIGVKASIRVVAWAAFLDQFIRRRDFQAVILGWTLPIDPDLFAVWHSDSSSPGGLNFISYSDPEVDALIEAGRSEFDSEERARIYREIHRLIHEDAPYTFLFFPYALPAVDSRFRGIEPAPAGIGYNFIDWYVPESDVRYTFRRGAG